MKRVSKSAVAVAAFACSAIFSFGWSQQGGVSLSVESAQARVDRPLTPGSVAGVARRHNRRAYGYRYGAGAAAAAAVGTAAAVASSAAYPGWGSDAYAAQTDPSFGQPFYPQRVYYEQSPYYGYSGWDDYATRNGIQCRPGSTIKLDDGQTYLCQ